MKSENEQILKDNEHHWITLRDAGYLKGLNQMEKDNLLRVMKEEFEPKALVDMWCGHCVAKFVERVYVHYNRWKSEQAANAKQLEYSKPEPIKRSYKVIKFPYKTYKEFLQALPTLQAFTDPNLVIIEPELKELAIAGRINFLTTDEYERINTVIDTPVDIVYDLNMEYLTDIMPGGLMFEKPVTKADYVLAPDGSYSWPYWQQLIDFYKNKSFVTFGDTVIPGSINIHDRSLSVSLGYLMQPGTCLIGVHNDLTNIGDALPVVKTVIVSEHSTLNQIKKLIR